METAAQETELGKLGQKLEKIRANAKEIRDRITQKNVGLFGAQAVSPPSGPIGGPNKSAPALIDCLHEAANTIISLQADTLEEVSITERI